MKFKFVIQLDEHELSEFAKEAAPALPNALLNGFKYVMEQGDRKKKEAKP